MLHFLRFLSRSTQNLLADPNHPDNIAGEGFLGNSILQLVGKNKCLFIELIPHFGELDFFGQSELLGNLGVMGAEKGNWFDRGDQMFEDGFCDGHSVERGGASPQFIDYDKAVLGSLVYNLLGLLQLDVKSGFALVNAIGSPNSAEYLVKDRRRVLNRRDEAPELCQNYQKACLFQESGFSTHIWASQQQHPLILIHFQVI